MVKRGGKDFVDVKQNIQQMLNYLIHMLSKAYVVLNQLKKNEKE